MADAFPTAAIAADPVNLDTLEPQQYHCAYKGRRFVLHEPTEGVKAAYHAAQFRGAQIVGDKVSVNMERSAEAPSLLVSMCLKEQLGEGPDGKPREKPLTQEQVKAFGGRLVKFLDEKAREMGGMGEGQEQLERTFQATAEKLVRLSKTPEDRSQWRDWMVETVGKVLSTEPSNGSPEEQAKN